MLYKTGNGTGKCHPVSSAFSSTMIYTCIALLALSTAVPAQFICINPSFGCLANTECAIFGNQCEREDPTVVDSLGCCSGAFASTATTTIAPVISATVRVTVNSTCVDLLNPLTGVSDCPARANLCTQAVYLDVMKSQRPRTCGFCTSNSTNSTRTSSCVDLTNPATGVAYCNNAAYTSLMRVQCPATCGFC